MDRPLQLVAICGDSLLLAAIETSLRRSSSMELLRVSTGPRAVEALAGFKPDVILFDITAPDACFSLTFLQSHPDSLLVGLDLDQSTALVLSGETRTLVTAEDLAQIVLAKK
jgi:CheY-like chemotaxis protein